MSQSKQKHATHNEATALPATGFQTLLVPIDLTASSDRVLGRLAFLPLARGARITLLHVVPDTLTLEDQRSAERDAKKALREEARVLLGTLAKGVKVELLIKTGSAADVIAASARALRAELVVMGRGGARALRDIFLGSTAERVIRRGERPVLVVRLPPRKPYVRPALALDLDRAAKPMVSLLLRVLPRPRMVVWVIHALSVPYQSLAYPSLPGGRGTQQTRDLQIRVAQALRKLLNKALVLCQVESEEAPIWHHHVRIGSPITIIGKAVKAADIDLLVLGTQGRKGLAHIFLGTVAGEVLRDVACDVLVVPPAK